MYPIRERCFRLGEDSEITEIRKRLFTPFGDRFTIDVPGPDDLELTGDLLDPNSASGAAARRWPPSPSAGSADEERRRD